MNGKRAIELLKLFVNEGYSSHEAVQKLRYQGLIEQFDTIGNKTDKNIKSSND